MASKELIAASTRPLVLAILAKGESYGYSIIQQVKELSGGELEWSEGMLYPVLHRMERDELIIAKWKVPDGGRRRKYYRLSASGKRAIKTEQRQWLRVHETLMTLWGTKSCST